MPSTEYSELFGEPQFSPCFYSLSTLTSLEISFNQMALTIINYFQFNIIKQTTLEFISTVQTTLHQILEPYIKLPPQSSFLEV